MHGLTWLNIGLVAWVQVWVQESTALWIWVQVAQIVLEYKYLRKKVLEYKYE